MKYVVPVTRTVCQTISVEVDADDEEQARDIALDLAPSMDFSGRDDEADYDAGQPAQENAEKQSAMSQQKKQKRRATKAPTANARERRAIKEQLAAVAKRVDDAMAAAARGDDPWPNIDESWATLNRLHDAMDEGKLNWDSDER